MFFFFSRTFPLLSHPTSPQLPLLCCTKIDVFCFLLGRLDKPPSPVPHIPLSLLGDWNPVPQGLFPYSGNQTSRWRERGPKQNHEKLMQGMKSHHTKFAFATWSWKENAMLMISKDLYGFDFVPLAEYCFCLDLNPQSSI